MVTIKDIAKAAGVDPSTVSRTLSDSPRVKEKTKQKIRIICDEMGYIPNAMARALVKRSTNIVGMLVPDISNSYYSDLMVLAGNAARKMNLDILYYNSFQSEDLEKKYYKLLIEHQVDAIIVHPVNGSRMEFFKKFTNRIPTVFIGDIPDSEGITCILTDNVKAGYMAAETLINSGCKTICCCGIRKERVVHMNRLKGIKEACKKNSISLVIPQLQDDNESSAQRGYKTIKNLFDTEFSADGIIAINDSVAMGIMKACAEQGVNIPSDLKLIGFDDQNYSKLPNISLSSINQDRKKVVEEAMACIADMMENGIKTKKMVVSPKVMVRNTTNIT